MNFYDYEMSIMNKLLKGIKSMSLEPDCPLIRILLYYENPDSELLTSTTNITKDNSYSLPSVTDYQL